MTWPRLLQRSKAAAYCDMSIPSFEREIAAGRFPSSIMVGGREHWCIKALDAAIDRLVNGGDVADYRQRLRDRLDGKEAA